MQRFLAVLFILLLIAPVSGARQEMYSKAIPSDQEIHLFFSSLLDEYENVFEKVAEEDKSAENQSLKLLDIVKTVELEAEFYEARGVKSNVSTVVRPFLKLSESTYRLANGQNAFLLNVRALLENENNQTAPVNARSALVQMQDSVDSINQALNLIDELWIWNGSGYTSFDTSDVRDAIEDILNLLDYYEKLLARFEGDGIFVSVSKQNPVLFEKIRIFIYSRNVTPEYLAIDGHLVPVTGDTVTYSFNKTGKHTIYATGVKAGESVVSNTVTVSVRKIPTYIILHSNDSAFIGEIVEVTGLVRDYYGNPLSVTVTARVDNTTASMQTVNGRFQFEVTEESERYVDVSVSYDGDETHSGATASLKIFFSRYPVLLTLNANKTLAELNETILFYGSVAGVDGIPVSVFVNDTEIEKIFADKNFSFTLSFRNPGVYEVHVAYSGNETLRPASSNKMAITIVNSKMDYAHSFAIMLAILLTVVAALFISDRLTKKKRKTDLQKIADSFDGDRPLEVELDGQRMRELSSLDAGSAYRILFDSIIKKYGLKRGMTPREVVDALKDAAFADKLKRVTEIHELLVYGGKSLDDSTRNEYIKLISEILEGIG